MLNFNLIIGKIWRLSYVNTLHVCASIIGLDYESEINYHSPSEPTISCDVPIKSEVEPCVNNDSCSTNTDKVSPSEEKSPDKPNDEKSSTMLSEFSEEMNDLIENLSNPGTKAPPQLNDQPKE